MKKRSDIKTYYNYYNLYNILKKNNRDDLFVLINSLSMEELIALKLELTSKNLNYKLYGYNLWNNITNVVRYSLILYAACAAKSKSDMARFLGIDQKKIDSLLDEYDMNGYFKERINIDNEQIIT